MAESSETESYKNVDDNHCILVEFLQENNSVSTGFLCWLDKNDQENILDVISQSKDILINWPEKCDITYASKMKNSIKNATWSKHIVHILAYDKWENIKRKEKSYLENNGILSPTRKQRQEFAKVSFSNYKKFEIKQPKQRSKTKGTYQPSTAEQQLLADIEAKKISSNNKDESELSSTEDDSVGDYGSDEDDDKKTQLMSELNESKEKIVELQKKISLLETENDSNTKKIEQLRLQKYTIIAEFDAYKENHSGLQDQLQSTQLAELKNDWHKIEQIAQQNIDKLNDIRISKRKPLSTADNSENTYKFDSSQKRVSDKLHHFQEIDIDQHDSQNNDGPTPPKQHRHNVSGSQEAKKNSYKISKRIIENCRQERISDFTNYILEALFSEEELATHSVTGKECNANRGVYETKPALDPSRLGAARSAAFQIFGKTRPVKTLFNTTARNKCGKKRAKLFGQKENADSIKDPPTKRNEVDSMSD